MLMLGMWWAFELLTARDILLELRVLTAFSVALFILTAVGRWILLRRHIRVSDAATPRCFICESLTARYRVHKATAHVTEEWDETRHHSVHVDPVLHYACSNGHELHFDEDYGGYIAGMHPAATP